MPSKRKRRKAREPELIDTGRASSPPTVREPSRSTMRVARANRQLAMELPDTIRQRTEPPIRTARPARAVLDAGAPVRPDTAPAHKLRRRPEPKPEAPLSMRTERAVCKARPTATKGSGASRPFVPWCDRRS